MSEFGKKVKKALIDMDKNQAWLIEQIKAKTGLYFDTSYMHKTLTGKYENSVIVDAICEILNITKEL
ncbi:MAG: XRE family transcriptional regulator [Clostridia bacterium]|nr:XRE family transcriptional regulator [Clostridia bacterium]